MVRGGVRRVYLWLRWAGFGSSYLQTFVWKPANLKLVSVFKEKRRKMEMEDINDQPSCVHNKHKLSQLDKTEKNLGNMLPFFSVHVRRRNTEATRSWWYRLKVTNQLIFCGFAVGQLLWASTVHSWVLSSLKTKIVKISFLAMWFLKSFQRAVLQSRATVVAQVAEW